MPPQQGQGGQGGGRGRGRGDGGGGRGRGDRGGEEEAIKEVVALFLGRTPGAVGGLHLELHEVEEV